MSPERQRVSVVGTDHQVTLMDAFCAEGHQHALRQGPTYPLATMASRNGEVVKVAAAAIVPSEDGGDQSLFVPSNETWAGIAFEVL